MTVQSGFIHTVREFSVCAQFDLKMADLFSQYFCIIQASEVVQFNKEYTEEDVPDQMKKGSFPLELSNLGPFDFFGLCGDIEAIDRGLFGGLGCFFEVAEETTNGFFSVFWSPNFYDGDSSSSSSPRRGILIESHPPKTQ